MEPSGGKVNEKHLPAEDVCINERRMTRAQKRLLDAKSGGGSLEPTKYIPAKRLNRLISLPSTQQKIKSDVSAKIHKTLKAKPDNVPVQPEKYTPGKRSRRMNSMPEIQRKAGGTIKLGASKHHRSVVDHDDDMTKVISLNCKLTNEVLHTKKLLVEKMNEYVKLQERLHQTDIERIQVKAMLLNAQKEIEHLKKEVDELKKARFCSDLITFDDERCESDSGAANGVMNNGLDNGKQSADLSEAEARNDTITTTQEIVESSEPEDNIINNEKKSVESSDDENFMDATEEQSFKWTPID